MARWKARLQSPQRAIQLQLNKAINFVLKDLDRWIRSELVRALVHGGFGIQGIADTSFYKFVSSPEGLSQLGIPASEPPKLLKAYEDTIRVDRTGLSLAIRFGDVALLKLATPHPSAGIGHLHVESWLEWILDGEVVNSGYVPRGRLPRAAQESIRLDSPLGGLMLKAGQLGSTGLWRFPVQLQNYERNWLRSNVQKIEMAILDKLVELLSERTRRG